MWVFFKAQLSSLLATFVDFVVTIFFVEAFKLHVVQATLLGALAGALTNFIINRYWSFGSTKDRLRKQGLRYAAVWLGSIILNTSGLYLLTQFFAIDYVIAKALVSVTVGIGFNYTLQKRYVFNTYEEAVRS